LKFEQNLNKIRNLFRFEQNFKFEKIRQTEQIFILKKSTLYSDFEKYENVKSIPNNKSSKVSVVNHFFGPIYPRTKSYITTNVMGKGKWKKHRHLFSTLNPFFFLKTSCPPTINYTGHTRYVGFVLGVY
jgi:hypothetical protein